LPVEAAPGTRAEYSDPGFILLGKALEVILGETLAAFAEREIHRPLGMNSTCFNPRPSARAAIPPTEEDRTFRHRIVQGEVQDENAFVLGGAAGHAGLFSCVGDLLVFAQEILSAHCNGSGKGSGKLFTAETVRVFSERQAPEGSSRALGWDTPSPDSTTGHRFSQRTIGHIGFSGCSFWIDLDASVAVALLTNRTWPDRQNRAIRQVWPAFHDAVREAL
jgi:CubicO group peptidase (beta-lactamase class C family)